MNRIQEQEFSEDEISLIDIIRFFIENGRTILFGGLLGLLAAILFLLITKPQYEGTMQIQMAQISSNEELGVESGNVEEASSLIARLAIPSSFSDQNIIDCAFQGKSSGDGALALSRILKSTPVKGVPNLVEIKIKRSSTVEVKNCLESIFSTIKSSQDKISEPLLLRAAELIKQKQGALDEAKQFLIESEKSQKAFSAVYLLTRDQIMNFNSDINSLQNFVNFNESRSTKMVAPVYVSEKPAFPKRNISILVGIFGGLFLGIAFVLVRQFIAQFQQISHLN
jgi:capsular polysaccharide biosynthesis protein